MTLSIRQVALWLALIIAPVYFTSLTGTYHFDDSHSVESNIAIRSVANIPSFWTDPRTSSFIPENRVYRPLVYTFYSFCWLFGGGKTWPFHVMKMVMHLLVCLAIFLIWRRLWQEKGWFPPKALRIKFPLISHVFSITPEWAAFFLAMIFAVHPTSSECVDYISATTSLQCAMFYLWAYYAYLLYRDSGDKLKLGLSLFLYFLSVASKEEGITLPAMIFITEMFLAAGSTRQKFGEAFKATVVYGVEALVLAAWIAYMHPESGNESRGWATPWEYFMTQWRAYLWYMRLWFWPWDLNADNASIEFSHSLTEPLVIQAAIGNLLVLAFSWMNRKKFPAMWFGILWFYIVISPASSVVVLAEAINEHRMYLAYVGFIGGTFTVLLACAESFFAPESRAKRLGWIMALILVGLVAGTQERNRVWANDENLWADTVEKNPTSGRALNNLALVYLGRGEFQKAVVLLERCELYWSTYMYCALNKGIAYQSLAVTARAQNHEEDAKKRFDDAEKSFQRAYSLNPRSVHVNFHLGKFYEEVRNDYVKASGYFRTAIDETGGRYPAAETHLANCYSKSGKVSDARAALDHALSVEPENQVTLFEKARLEFESGNADSAMRIYQDLLKVNPGHVQAWYNYGVAAMAKSDFATARTAFERTVGIDPRSEQGWFNLAYVGERLNDGHLAVDSAKRLVELNPSNKEFQERLQTLRKKFGAGG